MDPIAPMSDRARAVQARLGTTLDRYRIEAVLGVGARTAAYVAASAPEARPTACGSEPARKVVVRVLHEDLRDHDEARSAVLREAFVGLRFRHPARVSAEALGHTPEGLPYLLLEFVEGEPLDELVRREGPLPVDGALAVVEELLGVIGEAHRLGFVHGAATPSKLLLTAASTLRVLDCDARPRKPNAFAKQAPELTDRETSADLVAASVLLFALLAGVRPPPVAPPLDLVRRVASEAARESPHAAGVEHAICELISGALATGELGKAGRRFPTARAMRDAVAAIRELLVWQQALAVSEPASPRRALSIIPTPLPAPLSGVRTGPVARLELVDDDETATG
jgi:serine/threonine-protein kinase